MTAGLRTILIICLPQDHGDWCVLASLVGQVHHTAAPAADAGAPGQVTPLGPALVQLSAGLPQDLAQLDLAGEELRRVVQNVNQGLVDVHVIEVGVEHQEANVVVGWRQRGHNDASTARASLQVGSSGGNDTETQPTVHKILSLMSMVVHLTSLHDSALRHRRCTCFWVQV